MAAERLKTGEVMQIACVQTPDAECAAQIRPFLAHKPPGYQGHIEAAFADRCDALETRFYIGLIDGQMVGNIMTVETDGVGIFGHVHTRQDQRRKGICSHIMRHQMEEFRRRGGHVLLLGTGYQSPAYRIYESFGFRDWKIGRPGCMRYDADGEGEFERRFFAPAPNRPAQARWKHWPLAALLAAVPTEVSLRSLAFEMWGVSLLEGPYSHFLHAYGADHAAMLESETGAVVGVATCIPDRRWRGDVNLLDLFAHPNTGRSDLAALLRALPVPAARTQCCADPRDAEKIAALEAVGFRREAVLPNQFRDGDVWRDAWLYGKDEG
jgi:GNAT superfamily N-acetyltransferase